MGRVVRRWPGRVAQFYYPYAAPGNQRLSILRAYQAVFQKERARNPHNGREIL